MNFKTGTVDSYKSQSIFTTLIKLLCLEIFSPAKRVKSPLIKIKLLCWIDLINLFLTVSKFETKLNIDRKFTIKAANPFIKIETEIVFNNSMIPKSINLFVK